MKNPVSVYRKSGPFKSIVFAAVAALVFAFLIEIFIFRFSYFSQFFGGYEETAVDLSTLSGWNGEALAILPEDGTVSIDGLSVKARSVTVTTSGPAGVITGNIGICDEANAYKTVGAGSFSVNPGGAENSFTVRLKSHGDLTRLRITFDEELEDPIFLLSVTINARESLSPNLLRTALMAFILFLALLTVRFRPYAADYDPENWTHRVLNLCTAVCCMAVSLVILYAQSPDRTLLRSYPTLDEIRSSDMVVDAYMQQLDAFEKGQIELDLDVNPELEELDNPYDKGERDKKEVSYHWDRAYYNGKYYSYFGLAPLFMVYYPVYLLTGSLPTVAFAGALLALFAIICVFAAVHALMRLFAPRANLLLFLLGEAAVVCGGLIYMIQASGTFYYLPLLSAAGWLCAFIALSVGAAGAKVPLKRIVLFALSGISVVMIVLSRPTVALFAVLFAVPLFVRVLRDKELSMKTRLLESALPFLVPVLIGAAGIMWYNYIRFDSVFEFGTSYQLTESDIRYNSVYLSLKNFCGMLYHYFAESLVYGEFFPFVSFTTEKCIDFGNYLYQEVGAGLFNLPLNLGIFLLIPFMTGKKRVASCTVPASGTDSPVHRYSSSGLLAKQTYILLAIGVLILGYLNFMLGGIHIRYVCDLTVIVSLVSFMLILEYIHRDDTRSARILYVLTAAAMAVTIVLGLLLIFSNETDYILEYNPDFYLRVARIFHG